MKTAIWGQLAVDVEREGSPEGIIARCKEVGIDTYLAYVYPSPTFLSEKCGHGEAPGFAYRSTAFQGRKEDLLTPLTRAAKREGVAVEPWLLPFRSYLLQGETEAELLPRTYQPLRGSALSAAASALVAAKRICPTWPENRARGIRMLKDFIENHGAGLTGIDMDGMRYADGGPTGIGMTEEPCHCAACRAQYKELIGKDTLTAEDLRLPGVLYRFVQFRNRCIRTLLEEIRDLTQRAGLRLTLSAVVQVFEYALLMGQDWPGWVRDGLLDIVFMMNYSLDREIHRRRVQLGVDLLGDRGKALFCDGVGKKSSAGENPTDRLMTYIGDALDAGVDGISIYHYNGMKDEDFAALKALNSC